MSRYAAAFNFRLTIQQAEWVRNLAVGAGCSEAEVLRLVLQRFFGDVSIDHLETIQMLLSDNDGRQVEDELDL